MRKPHAGDFEFEADAHVVSSSLNVNNINLFFGYSDPAGKPLEETQDARRTADYGFYHKLNGYIVTFLNDEEAGKGKARVRIRRNPGFRLLAETFAYECRAGKTYHLRLVKRGGEISFSVDGKELLRANDPEPLGGRALRAAHVSHVLVVGEHQAAGAVGGSDSVGGSLPIESGIGHRTLPTLS